jgi:hypothetical protein
MIENGSLFQSTGTGWSWSLIAAGTAGVVVSKNASVTELSLNRAALGTLSSVVRVAYLDLNTSYVLISKLPSSGGYAPYTLGGGSGVTIPSAPSAMTASAVSSSQINLTWADNSSNETGFRIERSTGTSTTYAEITTVGAGVTSYSNTGLAASTQYNYRVRSYNSAGNSAYTAVASATTQSGGGSTTITVNGDLADWSAIAAVTTATGQAAQSMKLYDNLTKVYFGISGSGLGTNYQIFIDTDNNASTGFQDTRFTSSGANYMIENGSLFQSTSTGWAWTPIAAGTSGIVASKNASVTELSVNKSALGTISTTIRAAYLDENASFVVQSKLPATGGYAPYVMRNAARIKTGDELEIVSEETAEEFMVYPNPASGQFLIVKSNEVIKDLSVQTLSSVQIYSDVIPGQEKMIETAEWAKGVYILRAVTLGGKVRIVKVIK